MSARCQLHSCDPRCLQVNDGPWLHLIRRERGVRSAEGNVRMYYRGKPWMSPHHLPQMAPGLGKHQAEGSRVRCSTLYSQRSHGITFKEATPSQRHCERPAEFRPKLKKTQRLVGTNDGGENFGKEISLVGAFPKHRLTLDMCDSFHSESKFLVIRMYPVIGESR